MDAKRPRVALFVTCIVDQALPEVGVATVRLLRRAGYAVDFPASQTCCGQPFFNSGFRDEARRLAQRMIEIFEPYDHVVAPSGSCVAMVRVEFPHLFEDDPDWHQRAEQFAAKTYELGEFLVHVAHWQPPAPDVPPLSTLHPPLSTLHSPRVTYHDSCHMNRLLHLKQEPRTLLAAAGYAVDEMAESERCCGFGGLFSIRMPEVSNAMTADKLRQANETEATTIVTSDPGCLTQLRGLVDDQLRVEHLAVLLDDAAKNEYLADDVHAWPARANATTSSRR
jgi:L-lactate dehydrogenase complex protein LldE